jgi:hypothetical protein
MNEAMARRRLPEARPVKFGVTAQKPELPTAVQYHGAAARWAVKWRREGHPRAWHVNVHGIESGEHCALGARAPRRSFSLAAGALRLAHRAAEAVRGAARQRRVVLDVADPIVPREPSSPGRGAVSRGPGALQSGHASGLGEPSSTAPGQRRAGRDRISRRPAPGLGISRGSGSRHKALPRPSRNCYQAPARRQSIARGRRAVTEPRCCRPSGGPAAYSPAYSRRASV